MTNRGEISRTYPLSDKNIEVTSLDISINGCFVAAGCSNGMVLLFDQSNPFAQCNGLLIGQIRARGMHTSLLVTVKFSEDARFCFAGVTKGSSEMLAIDMGKLLVEWSPYGSIPKSLEKFEAREFCNVNSLIEPCLDDLQQIQLANLVTFIHSDAKLRGFGSVACVTSPKVGPKYSKDVRYKLACGKGIKNIHIWLFKVSEYLNATENNSLKDSHVENTPVISASSSSVPLQGKWECIYDVASNGNTLTHIEFRHNGKELLSKSANMNIRVWDLYSSDKLLQVASEAAAAACENNIEGEQQQCMKTIAIARSTSYSSTSSSSTGAVVAIKPSYVDIANSSDVKCLLPFGNIAYGGTYELAMVNTAAPKEANRDALALPERYSGGAGTTATSGSSIFLPTNTGNQNLMNSSYSNYSNSQTSSSSNNLFDNTLRGRR